MKTLPVDLRSLVDALEDHDASLQSYYFDTQTGEVMILSEELEEEAVRMVEIREDPSGRFLPIEPMDSHEGYRIMQDFLQTLPPIRLREKLEWALDGPKPFRRFKDALREDREIRNHWFDFQGARMRSLAIEWLGNHDIRPEGVETGPTAAQEWTATQGSAAEKLEEETEDREDTASEEPAEAGEEELFEPLSEDEEAELMVFLEPFPGEGVSLAKLHGLFTALAAGPGPVSTADLLPITMQAGGKSAIKDVEGAQRILELLRRFYSEIVDDLASETFVPRLEQQGIMVTDIVTDISSWCQGFVLGLEHGGSAWQRWFKDLRREKAISLIIGTAKPEIQAKLDVASDEEVAWTTHGLISDLVPLISGYWRLESALDELVGPQPTIAEPRIGRNRQCPCGSGKKYKHCCGKGE